MSIDEGNRKLAAILAADAAGYSRLMADDERATVRTLTEYREVFVDRVEVHQGRVVDTAGDSVLAIFDSVVEAVEAAVDIQQALAERNAQLPDRRRMLFRIGVNLGDIIVRDDGTIYGDGVNVAARLEGLAEPGGVMVSGGTFDQIEGKLDYNFEFTGEQSVKNIARPIRGYRLETDQAGVAIPSDTALPLPSKPSIAVLPFTNMSSDPEQAYFADGIAEDLITALSRLRWLFVVARNSTFTYKGQPVDVKRVARDLGVRYIVEGSVRRGGDRVRISVQLADAVTLEHVWAERYDRPLRDVFTLQDEITETIAATIAPELEAVERHRARLKPPEVLDAWETYQKGFWHIYQFTADDSVSACCLFRNSITRAPDFAPPYAGLAYGQFLAHVFDYPQADLQEALQAARRAVSLDDRDAMAHFAHGRVLTALGEVESAVAEILAAIQLNPSFALAYYALGYCRVIQGRNEEAISALDMAIRLSPREPSLWAIENIRAGAYAAQGDLENALTDARNAVRRPNAPVVAPFATYNMLISILGLLGRKTEALPYVEQLRRLDPDFQPEAAVHRFGFTDTAKCAWYIEGLGKAGISPGGWPDA